MASPVTPRAAAQVSRQEETQDYLFREYALRCWLRDVLLEEELLLGTNTSHLPQLLQNGVRLCKLMLTLKPKSIPRIHVGEMDAAKYAFKQRENIFFFLEACAEYGVPSNKLFKVEHLYKLSDFVSVLECLESLAKVAEKDGFYFKLKTSKEAIKAELKKETGRNEFTSEDQTRATTILEASNRRKSSVPLLWHQLLSSSSSSSSSDLNNTRRQSFSMVKEKWMEEEKQQLNQQQQQQKGELDRFKPVEAGVIRLQAMARGWKVRRQYRVKVRNAAYRENVAREIYQTERDYVNNLNALFEGFLLPIRKHIQDMVWVSPNGETRKKTKEPVILKDFLSMISDLTIIQNYNAKLLAEIEPRIQNWSPSQQLGDIFSQFLKVYTMYVKDYEKGRRELAELRSSNVGFQEFLKECAQKHKGIGNQEISTFLIQPVQRIPRYLMLLKDLTKHTESDHKDYTSLQQALSQIEGVAHYIETKSAEAENNWKMLRIQERIVGKSETFVRPGRLFVREGELNVWTPKLKKKQPCIVFLFSDLVLITRSSKDRFRSIKSDKSKQQNSPPISPSSSSSGTIIASSLSSSNSFNNLNEDGNLAFLGAYDLRVYNAVTIPDYGDEPQYAIALNDEDGELTLKLLAPNQLIKNEWLVDLMTIKKTITLEDKARADLLEKAGHSPKPTARLRDLQQQQSKVDRPSSLPLSKKSFSSSGKSKSLSSRHTVTNVDDSPPASSQKTSTKKTKRRPSTEDRPQKQKRSLSTTNDAKVSKKKEERKINLADDEDDAQDETSSEEDEKEQEQAKEKEKAQEAESPESNNESSEREEGEEGSKETRKRRGSMIMSRGWRRGSIKLSDIGSKLFHNKLEGAGGGAATMDDGLSERIREAKDRNRRQRRQSVSSIKEKEGEENTNEGALGDIAACLSRRKLSAGDGDMPTPKLVREGSFLGTIRRKRKGSGIFSRPPPSPLTTTSSSTTDEETTKAQPENSNEGDKEVECGEKEAQNRTSAEGEEEGVEKRGWMKHSKARSMNDIRTKYTIGRKATKNPPTSGLSESGGIPTRQERNSEKEVDT